MAGVVVERATGATGCGMVRDEESDQRCAGKEEGQSQADGKVLAVGVAAQRRTLSVTSQPMLAVRPARHVPIQSSHRMGVRPVASAEFDDLGVTNEHCMDETTSKCIPFTWRPIWTGRVSAGRAFLARRVLRCLSAHTKHPTSPKNLFPRPHHHHLQPTRSPAVSAVGT